jgi:hypothetical protein
MKMIRLIILLNAALGLLAMFGQAAANQPAGAEAKNADYQELAREAVELTQNKDPKTRQGTASKIRLKDGSTCTLQIGTDRQARCVETGKAFNALIVQCGSMPQQLRARCEAAQSTSTPKGR